jgi:hypothetical protein
VFVAFSDGGARKNFRHVTTVPPPLGPFSIRPHYRKLEPMASDPNTRKDTLKVEKLSLLILTLCVAVLVGLLVFKPF